MRLGTGTGVDATLWAANSAVCGKVCFGYDSKITAVVTANILWPTAFVLTQSFSFDGLSVSSQVKFEFYLFFLLFC